MDLRSTPLSYIFNALFRDTPLGHVYRTQPNSQIAKLAKYLDIWLFGYLAVRKTFFVFGTGQWSPLDCVDQLVAILPGRGQTIHNDDDDDDDVAGNGNDGDDGDDGNDDDKSYLCLGILLNKLLSKEKVKSKGGWSAKHAFASEFTF